ncbi:MAG: tetraacyldisaccharide 4'-kinase [Deferribacteres bacterium]|nr:tetraacyldisaccharide 4'-kinase [Deferribacteres bacterium]
MGLLSALYGLGLSCRRLCYSCLKKPERLPARVISVGNLTLGGTGKTPAVIALALEAKKRGLKPCVLTRGYRGRTREPCFVSKGAGPLLNARAAGDEALLMAETLRGIPVVKGRDRYKAGLFALEGLRAGALFILDDGFQHWGLGRDMDVLLIDATNPFGNGRLFPEGILREPLSAMRRADFIVITKADTAAGETVAGIRQEIRRYNPDAPVFEASHKPAVLVSPSGETTGLDTLRGRDIYAFAGIANPSYFRSLLLSQGARLMKFREFRDHYFYRQADMDEIKRDAGGLDIITTEKDLVKIRELRVPDKISALRIEFSVAGDFYSTLFSIILNVA